MQKLKNVTDKIAIDNDEMVIRWGLFAANTLIMMTVLFHNFSIFSVVFLVVIAGLLFHFLIRESGRIDISSDGFLGEFVVITLSMDVFFALINYCVKWEILGTKWVEDNVNYALSCQPVLWIILIFIGAFIYFRKYAKPTTSPILLWIALELMGVGMAVMQGMLDSYIDTGSCRFLLFYSVINLIWICLFNLVKSLNADSARKIGKYPLIFFCIGLFLNFFCVGADFSIWLDIWVLPGSMDHVVEEYLSGIWGLIIMGSIVAVSGIQLYFSEENKPETLILISIFEILLVIKYVHTYPFPLGVLAILILVIVLVKIQNKHIMINSETIRGNSILISLTWTGGICSIIYLLSIGQWIFTLTGLVFVLVIMRKKLDYRKTSAYILLMACFCVQGCGWLLMDYIPVLTVDGVAADKLMHCSIVVLVMTLFMMAGLRLTTEKHPGIPDFMVRVRPAFLGVLILLLVVAINSYETGITFELDDEGTAVRASLEHSDSNAHWYWTELGSPISYDAADKKAFTDTSGNIPIKGDFLHVVAKDVYGNYTHRTYYYPRFHRDPEDNGVVFDFGQE